MEERDFSDFLNNTKDLTIGQIFKLISNLKYKVLLMFFATFIAVTGSAYVAGKAAATQETAVMLQAPFSMRINIENKNYDFKHLTLVEDPMLPKLEEDTIMLSLREVQSAFDIVPRGQIVAKVHKDHVPAIWKWLFSSIEIPKAHAKEAVFDWNGHGKDMRYKEKHEDDHLVHRYYTDECILEYMMDSNRRSIPSSFRWIKKTH